MSKETPVVAQSPMELDVSTPMEKFLEAHFKKVVLLFAVLVVAALAYGAVTMARNAAAKAAGEAFAAAKTVEDCDRVISEHAGTVAAGSALLLKADLLWDQNKKDSSVAALREFASKNTDHPLIKPALLGLGSKLDSIGERDEAAKVFQRVVSEYPSTDEAALAQLRLGDLLWAAGKEDEAKAAYESVPAKYASASQEIVDQSENRLKWISAKLPTKEVDGPPKPKVEASAAPVPGAPQIKIDSPMSAVPSPVPGLVVPPASSPAPAAAPKIDIKPAPAPAPAAAPAPAPEAKPAVAPAAPAAPAPVPAPTPAPAPKVQLTPVPDQPPVTPAPAPAAPKIEVKPAPATPAPVPAPAPAPVPAPAQPEPPAPAPEVKPS